MRKFGKVFETRLYKKANDLAADFRMPLDLAKGGCPALTRAKPATAQNHTNRAAHSYCTKAPILRCGGVEYEIRRKATKRRVGKIALGPFNNAAQIGVEVRNDEGG